MVNEESSALDDRMGVRDAQVRALLSFVAVAEEP